MLVLFGYVVTPYIHFKGSDSRATVVDGGSQQALPALRVIFVGQLAST